MQNGNRPHPKTALGAARRDRRAFLNQAKAAEALNEATNNETTVVNAQGKAQVSETSGNGEAAMSTDSNKENAAPEQDVQQQGTNQTQSKANKKKKGNRKRRDSHGKFKSKTATTKAEDEKITSQVDGVVEGEPSTVTPAAPTEDNLKANPPGSTATTEEAVAA
jgi:hypothetical protein